MRQITDKISKAFKDRINKKISNSTTDGKCLWLFGNMIAMYDRDGNVSITTANHATKTTKDRLNGILDVFGDKRRIYHKAGQLYLGDQEWDGDWVAIGNKPD